MSDSSAPPSTPRREFLSAATLSIAGFAGACASSQGAGASSTPSNPAPTAAQAATPQASRPAPVRMPPPLQDGPFDHSWVDRLAAARTKQVFDVPTYAQGGAIFYALNYLNAHRDFFATQAPDVQIVMGIGGTAHPLVFTDALWAKYGFGEDAKMKDNAGAWSTRNPFGPREGQAPLPFSVAGLQSRGATFIFCNNVLRQLVGTLAARTGGTYELVRAELKAGLLPGVVVVPAMVAALGMAQARGCSYVYAGA